MSNKINRDLFMYSILYGGVLPILPFYAFKVFPKQHMLVLFLLVVAFVIGSFAIELHTTC